MATFKTPGVYIEEVSTIPPSVAGVPTAVPGFVGYTFKAALLDGTVVTNVPVRITSLLEYEQIFGGPQDETFTVSVSGSSLSINQTTVSPNNFILYYQIQMFYANGGGTCYVVSVGNYTAAPASNAALKTGIDKLEQIDEVTLLVAPESVYGSGSRKALYDAMLAQCAKLQDRFAVLDVVHTNNFTILQDASAFRNNDVSADNLKYGASYYPQLNTVLPYSYKDTGVQISGGAFDTKTLDQVLNGVVTTVGVTSSATILLSVLPSIGDELIVNGVSLIAGTNFAIVPTNIPATAINLFNAISSLVNSVTAVSVIAATVTIKANIPGAAGTIITTGTDTPPFTVSVTAGVNQVTSPGPDKSLYNNIKTALANYTVHLYPSAAMVGTYARVDADRGVWKAPANVGLRFVNNPDTLINDQDQENLNVDSVSGKSINAIRTFAGRGVLVWGARTLAGNDNEWRYVNVRRLFIYAEESIRKATEFVVFEPNTANTWNRVRGMATAFLTQLWKDGALAGATPEDAFFVNVGLGTTMTAQDILEGRMIVEIGLAAVRPAEFIILRFSHKLQES